MRNQIIIALMACILVACQQKKEQSKATVLQGKIDNTIGGSFNMVNLKGFEKTINVKDNGTFTDTLDVPEGVYFATYEKSVLQFYFGDDSNVKFTADANDFYNTLHFEGSNAGLNNYYAFKNSLKQGVQSSFQTAYGLSEELFLNYIDSTKNVMLERFKEVSDVSDRIKNLEQNAIDIYAQGLIRDYPLYHPYMAKKENYEPSESFKSEIKEIDYTLEEDYFYSQDYNSTIMRSVMREAGELREKDTTLLQRYAELKIIEGIENDSIRENLLATFANMALSLMKDGRKKYYDTYMSMSKDTKKQQKITALMESLAQLAPGKPSPKFEDYEDYNGGVKSLEDFKGKYVYIDVWATWCGPCKAEIPHLKEIEEQYEDKNIEFVSISVDTRPDYQKWKDMIAEKEMGGTQLFANDAFNSSFVKAYQIRGIPQFILLDPEGNIVSAQAPRPSEKDQLTKLFNDLNI